MANLPYPTLSLEMCTLIAQLASPLGTGRLTPHELVLARKALEDAIQEAREAARALPRADAQGALMFADALAAAGGTLDLIHGNG